MPEADDLNFEAAHGGSINPVSTLEPTDDSQIVEHEPLTLREQRARLGIGGKLAIAWLAFVTLAAVLAPVLPLDDPNQSVTSIVRQGPGTDGHLLGGDALGRDILSRMVWGGRASLLLAFSSVLLGLVVGGLLGLAAGYVRGRTDRVLSVGFDTLLSFPQIILAVTLVTVFASQPGTSATRRSPSADSFGTPTLKARRRV